MNCKRREVRGEGAADSQSDFPTFLCISETSNPTLIIVINLVLIQPIPNHVSVDFPIKKKYFKKNIWI